MAHVLIGWEFGGNRGHAVRMALIADALRARGHRLSFALQRIDALYPTETRGAPVWQAPVSPRLLAGTRRPAGPAPATMGDILMRLGLDEPAMITAVLAGWRQLLGAIRPDVLVAEFAPFLLSAARGIVPTLAVGAGFDTPPSSLPRFPGLTGRPALFAEEEALACFDQAVLAAGCRRIDRLPQLFEADRQLPATFRELDPYAEWRQNAPTAPALPRAIELAPGSRREVFVYGHEWLRGDARLWQGLAAARLPVRAHVPRLAADNRRALAAMGFVIEQAPLPFADIARTSRLLVSHGGHGFVSSGLLAGLPQVVCHYDLEKLLNGAAVARMELGGLVGLGQIEPEAFAASLRRLYDDDALAARARAAADDFGGRCGVRMEQAAADAVEVLVR